MSNAAFHKLHYEFDLNYMFNADFKEYCDNSGIMTQGFYGEITASVEDMKKVRSYWKKSKKVWLEEE